MACLPACLSRALETHHPAVPLRGFALTWVPDVDTEGKRTPPPQIQGPDSRPRGFSHHTQSLHSLSSEPPGPGQVGKDRVGKRDGRVEDARQGGPFILPQHPGSHIFLGEV